MAKPTSRATLVEYCLRRLGAPVMQINVDDDQVEDRIDDALDMFFEYHADAARKIVVAYTLTQGDIDEKRVPVPERTYSVIRVFPMSAGGGMSIGNISYTAAMSDIWDQIRTGYGGKEGGDFRYMLVEQHLSMLEQFFNREKMISFNRHDEHITMDTDWTQMNAGDIVLMQIWQRIDMEENTSAWSDKWLQYYSTALIKQQWGMNMIKYDGFQLPSGITLNGRQIYDDAVKEIEDLEARLQDTYQLPVDMQVG